MSAARAPSLRTLLHELAAQGRVPRELADRDNEKTTQQLVDALGQDGASPPWFVRVLVGAGTWVGASLVALVLALTEVFEHDPARLVGGLLFLLGAAVVSRLSRSDALTQVVFILSFTGQALLLSTRVNHRDTFLLVLLGLQVVLLFAVSQPILRFLSTVAAVGALAGLAEQHDVTIAPPLLTVAALWSWLVLLIGDSWLDTSSALRRVHRPVMFGLLVSVLGLLLFYDGTRALTLDFRRGMEVVPLPELVSGAALLAFCFLAERAYAETGRFNARAAGGVVLAAVVMTALTWRVPGVVVGLVVIVAARLRGERVIQGLGTLFLAAFLFAFGYQLQTPLLHKSLYVAGTGVALLVARALAALLTAPAPPSLSGAPPSTWRRMGMRSRVLLAGSLAALAVLGVQVTLKERVLANGRRVLLPLRPVDPRSLMQGDYMVLRYAVENELPQHAPRDGRLVLAVAADDVARFVRLDDGTPPQAGEARVRYRRRDWELRIGADSYFFQEGQADTFAGARYGELRVTPAGDTVLVGLCDAEKRPLGR